MNNIEALLTKITLENNSKENLIAEKYSDAIENISSVTFPINTESSPGHWIISVSPNTHITVPANWSFVNELKTDISKGMTFIYWISPSFNKEFLLDVFKYYLPDILSLFIHNLDIGPKIVLSNKNLPSYITLAAGKNIIQLLDFHQEY